MNISSEENRLREYIRNHLSLTVDQLQTDPVAFSLATDYLTSDSVLSTDPTGAPIDRDSEEWFEKIEFTLMIKHKLISNTAEIVARAREAVAAQTAQEQPEVGQYFKELYVDVQISDPHHVVVTFQPQRAAPIPPAFIHKPTAEEMLQCGAETYNVYFGTLLRWQQDERHSSTCKGKVLVTLNWLYKTPASRIVFDTVMYL